MKPNIMHKIILSPTEEPENWVAGEGKSFGLAATSLLTNYVNQFGENAVVPVLFEVLGQLDEEEGTTAEHYDMSCPEDNFSVTHTITDAG